MRGIRAIGVVIAVASCNYDWTYRPDAGPTTPLRDAGADASNPNEDASGPIGNECTRANPTCPVGKYCIFGDRQCGATKDIGECQTPPPYECDGISFCSCDGTVLAQPCEHAKLLRDWDETRTSCGAFTFKCGDKECTPKDQFCKSKGSGASYECTATGGCNDCKCIGFDAAPGCTCDASNPAQIVVKCD